MLMLLDIKCFETKKNELMEFFTRRTDMERGESRNESW